MRHPARHIRMPTDQTIYFHVMLYFIKYNNSIPFIKELLFQANRILIDLKQIQSHSV